MLALRGKTNKKAPVFTRRLSGQLPGTWSRWWEHPWSDQGCSSGSLYFRDTLGFLSCGRCRGKKAGLLQSMSQKIRYNGWRRDGRRMKIAQTSEGQPIEASADAPKEAVCPCCGGRLLLRSRNVMGDGQRVYYWRHQGNQNRDCSARKRPGG